MLNYIWHFFLPYIYIYIYFRSWCLAGLEAEHNNSSSDVRNEFICFQIIVYPNQRCAYHIHLLPKPPYQLLPPYAHIELKQVTSTRHLYHHHNTACRTGNRQKIRHCTTFFINFCLSAHPSLRLSLCYTTMDSRNNDCHAECSRCCHSHRTVQAYTGCAANYVAYTD